jgi:ribonuclease Z
MDLDLVFLGTAGSSPTSRRAPAATLIRRGGDKLLIDCAEGTQRQLMRSNIGLPDLEEVFLTHFHADHYLGLPGMLKTFSLRGREVPITIYGPRGLTDLFAALRRIFGKLTYPYELVELQAGDVLDRGDYRLVTFKVTHGGPAFGYALVEEARPGRFDVGVADALGVPPGPERGRLQGGEAIALPDGTVVTPAQVLGEPRAGRKLLVTGDTAPSLAYIDLAHEADLLVHEATFCEDEAQRAHETSHSTAREAAQVAAAAGVRMLALTHLSSRYFGPEVAREARGSFENTVVPRDFDVIEIPFPERGEPHLIESGARRREPAAEVESG